MKKYLFVLLLTLAAAVPPPLYSQNSGTSLVMTARWDDGTRVQAVTLTQLTTTGEATVVTQTLARGRVSVSEPLGPNSVYYVYLVSDAGVQLLKFPVTTALINPPTSRAPKSTWFAEKRITP